jgi:hypothetical protein
MEDRGVIKDQYLLYQLLAAYSGEGSQKKQAW